MDEQIQGLKRLMQRKSSVIGSKFITVASGKGGVGKTNFSVNYAYTLANHFGKKVLLIDADIGMANIHILLGADPSKNMRQVLSGESIERVLVHSRGFDALLGFSGIDTITEMEEIETHRLLEGLERISSRYDYVIIDTGAGIDNKIIGFLRASNKSYIVTTPEPTALMDAYALIKSLYNLYGYGRFKVVVNMCKSKKEGWETFEKLRSSTKKFLGLDLELLGILSYTTNLRRCVLAKELIAESFPADPFSIDMKKIASLEAGELVSEQSGNFWGKVIDFLKAKD